MKYYYSTEHDHSLSEPFIFTVEIRILRVACNAICIYRIRLNSNSNIIVVLSTLRFIYC